MDVHAFPPKCLTALCYSGPCQTKCMHAGYKICVELLQLDVFHQLSRDVHAAKLQAAFCQDSSARVRRAGFHAWLALQHRVQGCDDYSEWDMTALQLIKARCTDRFAPGCMTLAPRACFALKFRHMTSG